jgi:predicted N-acetyltransferase YhbS
MFQLKHETENDKQEVEDLLDLVFSPSRKNLSSYSLRKNVPKINTLSFVAKNNKGSIVGIIRNWPIFIESRKNLSLLMGPIAVHPTFQGEGIGSYLINYSIKESRKYGWERAVLIGNIGYYKSFGFFQHNDNKIDFPSPTDPERILLLEIKNNSFDGIKGKVIKFN